MFSSFYVRFTPPLGLLIFFRSLGLSASFRHAHGFIRHTKNAPDRIYSFCQGRVIYNTIIIYSRCHLDSQIKHLRTFLDTSISMATNVCLTSGDTLAKSLFILPSAVHLTGCVLSGSQLPGLSVSARSVFISASTV